MTKKQSWYFIPALLLMIVLAIVVLITFDTIKQQANLFNSLSYGSSIASIAAVILALISIGISIKEPDINIYLGDITSTSSGSLQEIRLSNIGNATGNMAHAFIELSVSPLSPVSFQSETGLSFDQTSNNNLQQYRLDIPTNPMSLYPGQQIWNLLGFIQSTSQKKTDLEIMVQIVGSQGKTKKQFHICI